MQLRRISRTCWRARPDGPNPKWTIWERSKDAAIATYEACHAAMTTAGLAVSSPPPDATYNVAKWVKGSTGRTS